MDKRLQKRHKRQVERAKTRIKVSEPDVRTPEEVKAARDASRPQGGLLSGPSGKYTAPATQHNSGRGPGSAAKADA